MKSHARVAIIGGGAMGVSLLYHLAKRGWNDTVLIEKNELTAGSTWHAAGLCTHFAHNATIMLMRAHSVKLYREGLTAETGLPTGFHASGALRITRSEERMNEFRHVQGIGEFLGHEFRILTPKQLKEIYPLCHTEGIVGAVYEPNDGHVDPTLATNAMAAAARETWRRDRPPQCRAVTVAAMRAVSGWWRRCKAHLSPSMWSMRRARGAARSAR